MQRCRVWPGRNAAFLQPHKTQYFVYKSTFDDSRWRLSEKKTQRQYHDRNFRNQLRSQNQRCLQLSAAACSACCFDSKSIATRRAKNTSTNQSCLQQPYHCIFSHQKVCLSWGPVNGQVLVHNPVDLCTGCGPCFRCFKEISWNILCTPLNSALQLYRSFVVWTYGLGNSYSYLGFSLETTKGGVNLYSQCI